ncbi:formiminoglutamate deiminase [Rhodopseudomonas julia]|uniref:Formiminoglutamate deiminase n=1 Tax=Rhodopseudomonas julia TaxID=200617 RepID=A0ABU0C731_9BRAD|nr:formimidoylglutamate deiminase [Rhodopseudomonas julia]MDQ0325764.1 formiminoglutamate deiminase [Rhodopseudomonas julia]
MIKLRFDKALLPTGWAENVVIDVADDGAIAKIETGQRDGGVALGVALPGLPNLHSHCFQRGMAGLAERRGERADSFWTWREVMYSFLERLTPDDVEAIAAQACVEMLEGGFTALGEFHYLHHAPGGSAYNDIAEMAGRIVEAARATGIGLTLLPVFYGENGFAGEPLSPAQLRFGNDPERFARLLEASRAHLERVPDARIGIAPHSLRAIRPEIFNDVLTLSSDGPFHIHAAEQTKEVEECVAALGARPVEWLLDNVALDRRWCLIHATHMLPEETEGLARSGAVAGLCPITEASLGDGIFDGTRFLSASGAFGVGSDSNVLISAAEELRMLEYSQRLKERARNVLGEPALSTGRRLYEGAATGGAQALARPIGRLEVGCRADIVVLDQDHPTLVGREDDQLLDSYIFAGGPAGIADVYVGGEKKVEAGRHIARTEIRQRFAATMRQLVA